MTSLVQEEQLVDIHENTMENFHQALSIIEHDFPLEFLIAGELAQFETYAIPSISKLLHQTGQYEKEGLKRLDDTRATMYAIFTNPKGSAERETMVEHLNWVHGHYSISNEDSLYTLLRMFFHPLEWINKWGWRQLTRHEINAMTAEMVVIGKSMNIDFFSEDFDELNTWQENYREIFQHFHQDNQAVAEGTIIGIQAHFPKWTHSFISVLVRAWLPNNEVLGAMGLKQPSKVQRGLCKLPLIIWKYTNKVFRPWRRKAFSKSWLANYYPSYENNTVNYCQLGPKKLIKHRNKQGGCPFH